MTFEDIKNALEDLFDGTPETWRDLCADDVHCESIHRSSVGESVKNKVEMYEMLKGVQHLDAEALDVRCLVDTDAVIAVTHRHEENENMVVMNVSHIEDGKITAFYYAKTNR